MSKVEHPVDAPTRRLALVVAGMHRSGTSAMARVLGLSGARLPERLIQPGEDNPLGFWEPQEVVALNDEILRTMGSGWNDVFGYRVAGLAPDRHAEHVARARSVLALDFAGEGPVVLKDPRVSLLAPVWREALVAEGFTPVFVIMARHPLEVARSIAARDGAPHQASVLAWLSHVIAVERDTRDLPRVFVRYSDLVDDWRPVLEGIGRRLGLDLDPGAGAAIDAYLSRSERHHAADDPDWTGQPDLWPGVGEAWHWLVEAAGPDGPSTPFPPAVQDDLAALQARIGPVLEQQRHAAERRERELQRALADSQAQFLRRGAQLTEYQNAELRLGADLRTARDEAATLRDRLDAETTVLQGRLDAEITAHAQTVHSLGEARQHIEEINQHLAEAHRALAMEQQAREQLVIALAEAERTREQLLTTVATLEGERAGAEEIARAERDRAEQAEQAVRSLEARLEAMRLSPSWTLTRPIRVVRKRLAALSRRG